MRTFVVKILRPGRGSRANRTRTAVVVATDKQAAEALAKTHPFYQDAVDVCAELEIVPGMVHPV